jgi:beta-galactosidase
MALTAGTISQTAVSSTTATVVVTAATSGTSPYTYQWYKSTTSGFSPGGGNIISGATALTLSDTGLIPGTTYYYKNVVTDSASPAATSTASQLAVTTSPPVQSQNQFAQSAQLGQIDLPYNYDTVSVKIDVTQTTTLYAGAAVKVVANTVGGVPSVVGCSANSDEVFGFLNYDIKNVGWVAGNAAEVSQAGNVMFLYATGAITQGAQVQLDITTNGGVAAKVGSSGADYVGWAFDGAAAAGALIRVRLSVPSFTKF